MVFYCIRIKSKGHSICSKELLLSWQAVNVSFECVSSNKASDDVRDISNKEFYKI